MTPADKRHGNCRSQGRAAALLIIDMQLDLCRDVRRRRKVHQMLAPLVRAIDLFAGDGQPIFYTVMLLRPDDEQFARFGDRYCVEGTPGAEIIPELQPLRGPVIVKHKHSAFFETDLDDRLKECGVRDLYLAGLQTQICVMTTAADANFRGYRPTAIRDCVVSTRERTKTQALQWISKYVGNVIGISDVEEGLDHG